MSGIILFDGECNFCDHSVQFILKRDQKGYYKFASLQSEVGKELVREYQVPEGLDSIILIDQETYCSKSTAVLRICKHLKGMWKLLQVLIIVPKPFRDVVYRVIARNRYKWFGKKESCMIPSPEMRERFL